MSLIKSTKEILKILNDYKFSIFIFLLFEIIYFLKGYKSFRFTFSTDKSMTNSIPCPFYFLHLIKKNIDLAKYDLFVDFGSGYGRVIDYFYKNFSFKKILGIEYSKKPFNYCIKEFEKYLSVEFNNIDFNTFDLQKYYFENQSNGVCIFFSAPFAKTEDLINFVNKIGLFNIKNLKIIIVNYKYSEILKINNLKVIDKQYINETRGFCICTF